MPNLIPFIESHLHRLYRVDVLTPFYFSVKCEKARLTHNTLCVEGFGSSDSTIKLKLAKDIQLVGDSKAYFTIAGCKFQLIFK